MRTCTKCKVEKEDSDFYKDSQKLSGYRSDCKTCNKKNCIDWAKSNPQKRRFYVLKSATGLTKEQYLEILEKQEYTCQTCKIHIEDSFRNLAVDHCHETGFIRGLLCSKCNIGLGYFQDSILNLLNAISYLEVGAKTNYTNIKYKNR